MSPSYPAHDILTDVSSMTRYHRWIGQLFTPFWGKYILEIGSGTGSMTKYFPRESSSVLTDIDPHYVSGLKKVFHHPAFVWDVQKPIPPGLSKMRFDTVFSANVLEHVADDLASLKNIHTLLFPGGKLLLFVPAGPVLYGKLDRHLHHFRRYDKKQILDLLHKAGFKIDLVEYKNIPGFFAWGLVSRFLQLDHPVSNSLGARIFDFVSIPFLQMERGIRRLPFGQNLMVVATRI